MTAPTASHPPAGPPADEPAGRAKAQRRSTPYAQLTAQVQEAGLMQRRRGHYWVRIAATTAVLAANVAGIVLLADSWLVLLLGIPLALIMTQFAFLGHDAAHRQIFARHSSNEWAARIFAALVVGLSYGWWMGKHNRHHQAPNQRGIDGDIESDVVAFYDEAAESRRGLLAWFTRRQGWFFIPLLLGEGLNLHYESTRILLDRGSISKRRWVDASLIVVHWTVYLTLLLTLLGPGRGAAFFGVHMAMFGLSMGGTFAPNHTGLPVVPRTEKVDFIRRQVLMSRNIRGGWFVNLFMGGLNHQIEHHLFPSMPRPNLRRARPYVKAFCAEHGIKYTETTFLGAYRDIIRYLNEVGLKARNPFRCPLAAQLRGGGGLPS
ncbi:fatty acid desaturase [Kineococcus xinjiangensis]|uniref:Fatty acid desaturase n=1 Tax=Kineococcus xinjiangensis TaxID=512762 RepID=A0A2S6IV42_9ACTN|nr:acyl-CoA desaturase [Kineococcus xinjiangensis]PPK98078.1 fatty acid desaturase [Kineococcus xinjiangensis]